jgi:hypothetical protein
VSLDYSRKVFSAAVVGPRERKRAIVEALTVCEVSKRVASPNLLLLST